LEKVYERALVAELGQRGLRARPQVPFVVRYKETAVGGYYVDVLVEDRIIVELKAQPRLGNADQAQLLNYLKASGLRVGMLVNFAHPKAQIRRLVS
jgi:GxxExxY protein